MKNAEQNRPGRTLLPIVLVCFVTFFVNNDALVPDIMESRNIITAREMAAGGDWIVPRMNGELRLEKPPLPTWCTAAAELVLPDSLIAQRAMAGLAAILLVVFFWKFARRVLRIDPVLPTLLLCTCYNVILMGRTASWDIYTHGFMMGGIYFLARGLLGPRAGWRRFLAAGVFIGLSIMSKGPVSLYALFLPFLIAFIWQFRPSASGKVTPLLVMCVLALVVGAWWYAWVHIAESDALSAVVSKESGSWINHNVRPWWYYWKFFLEAGVWSLLLLTSIVLPLFLSKLRHSRPWLFSLIWMFASLVLLSLLPEKKTRYLLPMLIPASYVMGCMVLWWRNHWEYHIPSPTAKGRELAEKICFRINAWLVAVAVASLPVVGWFAMLRPGYISIWLWIGFTLIDVALLVWISVSAIRLRPTGLVWGVTMLFVAAEAFLMPAIGANIINNPERNSISATWDMLELRNKQFYHVDTVPLRIELVYAAHRTILPISPDSLRAKAPLVLLTHRPIGAELRGYDFAALDTVAMGCYDDNRRPKGTRRYNPDFIYYVTEVRPCALPPSK